MSERRMSFRTGVKYVFVPDAKEAWLPAELVKGADARGADQSRAGVARRPRLSGGDRRVVLEFPREDPELPRGCARGGDVRGDQK